MIPFAGTALPAIEADFAQTARILGVSEAVVEAVESVETGGLGGFLPDGSGRPRILFEASHFSAATRGAYDRSHPTISSPVWNTKLYVGGAGEYLRLEMAANLDRAAALASASWGLFQILGSNFKACGFATVDAYVAAMAVSEREHLLAFARFVMVGGMAAALQDHDWETFARRYNGPSYRVGGYVPKLAAAYLRAIGSVPKPAGAVLLIGSSGDQVRALQQALALATGLDLQVDGQFGPATEIAVRRFQTTHGLLPDGIAGSTVLALLLPPTGEA